MTREADLLTEQQANEVAVKVIDADVHPVPRSDDELRAYLSEPWRSLPSQLFSSLAHALYLPPGGGMRRDSTAPDGSPACSDPVFTEQQLFEGAGVDYAILIFQARDHSSVEFEAALCSAANRWLSETWLTDYNKHHRHYGSICVASGRPDLAVKEIQRWADHPHFVQVRMNGHSAAPYGDPMFHPIYEAASSHNLPVAVHFSMGTGDALLTPVGFVSYYFEFHSFYPMAYSSHLVSLIAEGVFDKYPALRFVFVEGGFSWVLPLMWSLEKHWNLFKAELPNAKKVPSDYLHDHIRFTTQPIEEPSRRKDLLKTLEWAGGERLLLFSSDYPHWDYDHPAQTLRRLRKSARTRIFRDNALELYGLPPTRPASPNS